jgi:sugar lactone lactonase YvrE
MSATSGSTCAGEPWRKTNIIAVDPDGHAWIAAEEMSFPNGMVITPDGRTLIVGESTGARLTAFDIAEDGTLSNRRVWASLKPIGATPDGICLDAENAVWVACPASERCVRVAEGGELLDEVHTGRGTFACALGGSDGRTLFMLTADWHIAEDFTANLHRLTTGPHTGHVLAATVSVPGAGWPNHR